MLTKQSRCKHDIFHDQLCFDPVEPHWDYATRGQEISMELHRVVAH